MRPGFNGRRWLYVTLSTLGERTVPADDVRRHVQRRPRNSERTSRSWTSPSSTSAPRWRRRIQRRSRRRRLKTENDWLRRRAAERYQRWTGNQPRIYGRRRMPVEKWSPRTSHDVGSPTLTMKCASSSWLWSAADHAFVSRHRSASWCRRITWSSTSEHYCMNRMHIFGKSRPVHQFLDDDFFVSRLPLPTSTGTKSFRLNGFCTEFYLGRLFWVHLIKWVSNVRRTSVHPQNVSSILMKFGLWVDVDEGCTTVCSMTRYKVKVKVTSPWKLEILPFSKAISSAIYNGSWQLTTDS